MEIDDGTNYCNASVQLSFAGGQVSQIGGRTLVTSAGTSNVQAFTLNGTWTVPLSNGLAPKLITVYAAGGGGGGGGGMCGTSTGTCGGGGGGGGGGFYSVQFAYGRAPLGSATAI